MSKENKIVGVRLVRTGMTFYAAIVRDNSERIYALDYASGQRLTHQLSKLCTIYTVEVTPVGLVVHYERKETPILAKGRIAYSQDLDDCAEWFVNCGIDEMSNITAANIIRGWRPNPQDHKLLDPNENPPDDWEECPVCNSYHPLNYAGDCRDNVNRWPFNPIHVDNVSNYLKRDQYINAIKYYRMETGATLQEGKQFVGRFLDR